MTDKIDYYKKKGWVVVESSPKYYTLERPKRFNGLALVFWIAVLNVFGLAGYLIFYFCKPFWDRKVIKK